MVVGDCNPFISLVAKQDDVTASHTGALFTVVALPMECHLKKCYTNVNVYVWYLTVSTFVVRFCRRAVLTLRVESYCELN